MDLQKMVDGMNEQQARDRSNYHLTYGELIDALKAAPSDAVFDDRIKGIGSWRGSYIEIALFTEEYGLYVQDGEFNGDYKDYAKWDAEHSMTVSELPTNAHELADLLESIIGKDFIGYKGGNFTIDRYKPLWLEAEDSSYTETAIIAIDKDLKLVTKNLGDDAPTPQPPTSGERE